MNDFYLCHASKQECFIKIQDKSTAVAVNLPLTTDEIDIDSLLCVVPTATAVDFNIEEFLEVSFSHHIEILNKVTDIPTRNKYIHIALDQKWPAKRLRE